MQLNFINTLPCKVNIEYEVSDQTDKFALEGNMYKFAQDLGADQDIMVRAFLDEPNCANYIQFDDIDTGKEYLGTGNGTFGYSILITERGNNLTITRLNNEEQLEKSDTGDPFVA
jgi:hypothetical protein